VIDWAQIIQALCTGLAVAIPALLTAYIGWRRFIAEQRQVAINQSRERQQIAQEAREVGAVKDAERQVSTERVIALGEEIRTKVNGNLERANDKLDVANNKIDELHAKVEAQAQMLTPVVAVVTAAVPPGKGAK
jgi:hypothetical protein